MQKDKFDGKKMETGSSYDLICFSHLRWDFVYQRPQHLLSRFDKGRVFYIEEPIFDHGTLRLDVSQRNEKLFVVKPCLPEGLTSEVARWAVQRGLLDGLLTDYQISEFVRWYYTPMAFPFSSHLRPLATVYDCMDELSAFKGAPPSLRECEQNLFDVADLVFTGGYRLYEAKRAQHPSVHPFPSSIDRDHFAQARQGPPEPEDQINIPHPRLGFCGVIDERFDIGLLDSLAAMRPDWNFVMIGPVVKIDPSSLPRHPNIHYLGGKDYRQLPAYFAGWDVALLLFAHNESTRFISPTKTPEYLAAGRRVISTSIHDVVRPYGHIGLVRIADTAEEFAAAAEALLAGREPGDWWQRVDAFLAHISWDETWSQMCGLIDGTITKRRDAVSAMSAPNIVTSTGQAAGALLKRQARANVRSTDV